MITTIQKWMMGILGLGALYLVVTNPQGFYSGINGLRQFIGGTVVDVTTGGKK